MYNDMALDNNLMIAGFITTILLDGKEVQARIDTGANPPVPDYLSGVFLNKLCPDLDRCGGGLGFVLVLYFQHRFRERGTGVTGEAQRNPFPQDVRFLIFVRAGWTPKLGPRVGDGTSYRL